MRKTALVMATALVGLLSTAAFAQVKSGLQVGESAGAFQVIDAHGSLKGKQHCYVWDLGGSPTVLAFIKPGSASAASLAAKIDKLMSTTPGLKAFVVYTGGPELQADLEKMATEKKLTVPLVFLPNGQAPSTYKVNPEADNTVLVYKRKKVTGSFVNVDDKTFANVATAAAEAVK